MNSTSPAQDDIRMIRLQWGLRLAGAAMILFFLAGAIAVLADIDALISEDSGILGKLLAWTDHEGHEYILMLSAIYISWGAFVVAAANDPLRNRLMVDFAIVGNLAHMAVMTAMAVFDSSHTAHLLGDVPLGLLLPIGLAFLWLPVRRAVPRVHSSVPHH